jgi:hypothetical protein
MCCVTAVCCARVLELPVIPCVPCCCVCCCAVLCCVAGRQCVGEGWRECVCGVWQHAPRCLQVGGVLAMCWNLCSRKTAFWDLLLGSMNINVLSHQVMLLGQPILGFCGHWCCRGANWCCLAGKKSRSATGSTCSRLQGLSSCAWCASVPQLF